MRRLFFENFLGGKAALGLLVLRLIAGLGLMFHGWGKIQNPMGWMGPDAPVPGILQALAAISEFGGGLALALGFLTPLAAFGILCTMATAAIMVHISKGDPFVRTSGQGGSYELASLYFSVAALMLLAGPGVYSLDKMIFNRRGR